MSGLESGTLLILMFMKKTDLPAFTTMMFPKQNVWMGEQDVTNSIVERRTLIKTVFQEVEKKLVLLNIRFNIKLLHPILNHYVFRILKSSEKSSILVMDIQILEVPLMILCFSNSNNLQH